MKYRVNLIQELIREERSKKQRLFRRVVYFSISFGVLFLSLFYTGLQIMSMRQKITFEREKLTRIEEEYRKYKATSMTVNKMDIELLNQLQHNRIYWTGKLASTAFYLPDNYWIEQLDYNNTYNVKGYGYIVPEQKQLITLDDYLNKLRADTTFNDDFPVSFLNSVVRTDEDKIKRVHFELSADYVRRN